MAGDKNVIFKYIIAILVILAINIYLGSVIAKKILDVTYNTEDLDTMSGDSGESDEDSGEPGVLGVPLELDAINLNPYNSSGEIFSGIIVLEASVEDGTAEFTDRMNQIMDTLSSYLAMKTVQELSDQKQWDTYRKEMMEILNNDVMQKTKVINLYVKQKLIQYD